MAMVKEKAHVYSLPGLLGWLCSSEILLEKSHENHFLASFGF